MKFRNNIYAMLLIVSLFSVGCTSVKNTCSTGWKHTKDFGKSCSSNTKDLFSKGWDKAKEVDLWIRDHMW